jgi:ribosomal protein L7/L12
MLHVFNVRPYGVATETVKLDTSIVGALWLTAKHINKARAIMALRKINPGIGLIEAKLMVDYITENFIVTDEPLAEWAYHKPVESRIVYSAE